MTGREIQEALSASARGAVCTKVAQYIPGSWTFDFDGRMGLNVQCPWRIVTDQGIGLGCEDDGQQFGLPAPIDGSAVALKLFAGSPLKQILVTEKTGDVVFELESGVRLEVFNSSGGYEGWNCGTPSGLQIIGLGGGTTASLAPK